MDGGYTGSVPYFVVITYTFSSMIPLSGSG